MHSSLPIASVCVAGTLSAVFAAIAMVTVALAARVVVALGSGVWHCCVFLSHVPPVLLQASMASTSVMSHDLMLLIQSPPLALHSSLPTAAVAGIVVAPGMWHWSLAHVPPAALHALMAFSVLAMVVSHALASRSQMPCSSRHSALSSLTVGEVTLAVVGSVAAGSVVVAGVSVPASMVVTVSLMIVVTVVVTSVQRDVLASHTPPAATHLSAITPTLGGVVSLTSTPVVSPRLPLPLPLSSLDHSVVEADGVVTVVAVAVDDVTVDVVTVDVVTVADVASTTNAVEAEDKNCCTR